MNKPTLSPSMISFANAVWAAHQKHDLLSVDRNVRTSFIYNMYNHSLARELPDWRNYLLYAQMAFTRQSSRRFKGQYLGFKGTGADLAEIFGGLWSAGLAAPVPGHAPHPTKQGRVACDWGAMNKGIESRLAEVEKELDGQKDAQKILGDFIYHWGPQASDACAFRIYLTPRIVHGPFVYSDFIDAIHGNRPRGTFPQEVKLTVANTGLQRAARSDRIVIYCANEEELKGGIDWLRTYQQTKRSRFENLSPRGTKSVDGLTGVAIADQPVADDMVMISAGLPPNQVGPGISFGSTRAAVLSIALENSKSLNRFKQRILKVGKSAKLDLELAYLDDVLEAA